MTERHCPICGDEIPATAHRLRRLCGKKECMMEQQRISGRKSYHKLLGHTEPEKRSCVVCSTDISDLRGNRVVCLKPECKEVIVKQVKREYYERVNGTVPDIERRRAASAAYRARKRVAASSASRPMSAVTAPTTKPITRPAINKKYQRKPKQSSKIEIISKPIRQAPEAHDSTATWKPKAFNLPEAIPVHSSKVAASRQPGVFSDPWDCAACCGIGGLCRLHQSMTDDGAAPPRATSYQEGSRL